MKFTFESYAIQVVVSNEHDKSCFDIMLEPESAVEDGLLLVTLKLRTKDGAARNFPRMNVTWHVPITDIQGSWNPGERRKNRNKGLNVPWEPPIQSAGHYLAPVYAFYSANGSNRFTFACSETLQKLELKTGVYEETAEMRCSITFFNEPSLPASEYEATIRLDKRPLPFQESIRQVGVWWEQLPEGRPPLPVPDHARLPVYSTWYAYHKDLTDHQLERECQAAKRLGCDVLIVDDGWHDGLDRRTYSTCGDWEAAWRFPDMGAFSDRVHNMGMKLLLWYALPFVGSDSHAWNRFQGKFLSVKSEVAVLDPRYPEVRSYLIEKLEQALVEWRLDGFKLDFIDFFTLESGLSSPAIASQDGRDYISVPEAVERLLGDMIDRLTVHHRDVLIEFRQTYIGPVMRRFGNMFRATDCPNDAIENRVRTVDIRLLCGNTAVHSDMTMWHPGEPVESAALQLINALFSVPQISVRLEELPPAHSVMLNYWLQFWRNHRDVLLDGELLPLHPELLYPVVSARSPNKQIIVVYAEMVIKPDERLKEIIIVNGCREEGVVVDLATNRGEARLLITDCCGNQVHEQLYSWTRGLHRLPVPPAGVCHFIIE